MTRNSNGVNSFNLKNKFNKKAGSIDKYIGEQIKAKRSIYGISQAQLGEILGITFQQIQKYEKGVNRTPAVRLYGMAKVFNMEIGEFFEGTEEVLKNDNCIIETSRIDDIKDEFDKVSKNKITVKINGNCGVNEKKVNEKANENNEEINASINKQQKFKSTKAFENEVLKLNRFFVSIEEKSIRKLVVDVAKNFKELYG